MSNDKIGVYPKHNKASFRHWFNDIIEIHYDAPGRSRLPTNCKIYLTVTLFKDIN